MTMQSKVSSPIEVTPTQPFSWLLALAILILGIVLGILATNLSTAMNKTDVTDSPARLSRDFPVRPNLLELEKRTYIVPQNALKAESARYSSLGLFYAAGREAQTQRAITAEAARYNGLAKSILPAASAVNLPHHDREYGLAALGKAEPETHTLAWPPRPSQFVPLSK